MSQHSIDLERRQRAERAVRHAIIGLTTAGTCLLQGREDYPADAQELATAMRDDITTMLGDLEALLAVIHTR